MPTVFSDAPQSLYLLLLVAAIVSSAIAYRTRRRKAILAAVVSGLFLLGIFLIDTFVESPREEANRKVQSMMAAATARDPRAFVEHISANFNYNGGNREAVRNSRVWEQIRQFDAQVVAWGFGKPDFQEIGENEIEIGFYCKGESRVHAGMVMRFVRARFVRDPDGQFRMKTLKFFSPEGGMNREDPIPGFP